MSYLLDTNACIAVINGRPDRVRLRLQVAVEAQEQVWVSTVVAFELWYGVSKSSRPEANVRRLAAFFDGPLNLLSFDHEDARAAGRLRATLESEGRPVGAYDLLIAGQALRRNLILVTANVSEFKRVRGLVWQDWPRLGETNIRCLAGFGDADVFFATSDPGGVSNKLTFTTWAGSMEFLQLLFGRKFFPPATPLSSAPESVRGARRPLQPTREANLRSAAASPRARPDMLKYLRPRGGRKTAKMGSFSTLFNLFCAVGF